MAETEDVLGRAPLFEALDEEGTKALRAGIEEVTLARGDRIFDEGDAGDRLYVILVSLILPSSTTYSRSPASPSSKSRSPRPSVTS